MALSYDDASTGLFTHLGKIIKAYNNQATYATAALVDQQAIFDIFGAGDVEDLIDGLGADYEGYLQEYINRKAALSGYALRRLQDRVTVLNEIGAYSDSEAEVIAKLIQRMITDSETIDGSVITGSWPLTATANGSNTGNGSVVLCNVLDGTTSPGVVSGGSVAAHPAYAGVVTQLACTQLHSFRVTSDHYYDGVTEGAETLAWEGSPTGGKHGLWEGGGVIGSLTPINSSTFATALNGDFESFANNVPTGWVLVSGTGGTHVRQETNASGVYHGTSSMRFDGDNSQATIAVSWAPDITQLRAQKMYAVTVRIKTSNATPSANVLIQFEGTGYSAGSTEKITIADGSHPTSFTLYKFFVLMPKTIPTDFVLAIRWQATPNTGMQMWIDDVAFGPVTYAAGLGAIAVRGSTPFVRNDRFTQQITNGEEGVFQKWFRQNFACQLPSDLTGSETIADSLAT